MKGVFKRITTTIKGIQKGGIRHLYIPSIDNKENTIDKQQPDNPNQWVQINDTEKIFELLLEQNTKMLIISKNGITASGPLGEMIGQNLEGQDATQKILNGTFPHETIIQHYPHAREETVSFIKQMKRDKKATHDFTWKYTAEEFQTTFCKTRESTACGPSGLHMSHWRADAEHDEISSVHAFFIWAAFALGFTYDRWAVSYHCMLQKLNRPYIHKLRIIQLFEGDFNGGLKYLLGRQMMKHLIKTGVIDEHAYGSIPGMSSQEAMQTLQYIYENHRIMKKDLIALFNDAAGCYDRVRPNQAKICSRRLGCPKSIIKTHIAT